MRHEKSTLLNIFTRILGAAILLSTGLLSPANANTISCAFAPHLSCSEQNKIVWENKQFQDATPFTQNESHLFISQNNAAYSYEITSGTLAWQQNLKSGTRYFYPVLDDTSLYLARSDGMLEKRDAASGDLIWSKKLAKGWVYPPVIIANKVVTGGQDRLIWVMDKQTGKIEHALTLDQELVGPLIQIGDYYFASTFNSLLSAFKPEHNTAVWKLKLSAPAFHLQTYDNTLIASNMDGNVQAIDVAKGKILWQQSLYNNAQYWATLHNQSLYSLNARGELNILNAKTGTLTTSLNFAGKFAQAPIVQSDSLVLFNTQGSVTRITLGTLPEIRRIEDN